jgi:hypothetical protein
VHENRKYQPAHAVWIFHRVVSSLVLKTVRHRVHRAFEAFDDPNWDLAQFVELRIFPSCDQVLSAMVAHLTKHSKTLIRLSCKCTESF